MRNILNNNKGVVLIVAYFFLVTLLGFSAVTFLRSIHEDRVGRISNNSLQAFYEAEAGLTYAYHELSQGTGFQWYTHRDRNTIGNPTPPISNGGFIDANDGCFCIQNRGFRVKTFPDPVFAGSVIILSQATVDGVTRTIEQRLEQESAYQYLFFYPTDHIFDTATYDGRNYAAIQVNGDILLRGRPTFDFLTLLSSGSLKPENGYIKRMLRAQFPDFHGSLNYSSSPAYPAGLSYYLYVDMRSHFYADNTYFKTGEIDSAANTTLPYYLQGLNSEWEFDKYAGSGSSTTPAYYNVGNEDLTNLALHEMCGHRGSVGLLSESKNITVSIRHRTVTESEKALFEEIYNLPQSNYESTVWNDYWRQWKTNHESDASYTDGKNWERQFFAATYNWSDLETPNGVNQEWWEDLRYGDDRAALVNDMAKAQDVDYYTGQELDRYFLNTKEQPGAWDAWLRENQLNQEGENKTRVQDRSQGGQYVDPGEIIPEEHTQTNLIKNKAIDGGIYIGKLETQEYRDWLECCENHRWDWARECGQRPPRWASTDPEYQTFLDKFVTEKEFYNAKDPARSSGYYSYYSDYRPSRILEIDVRKLTEALKEEKRDFNGIIYVELENFQWETRSHDYDPNADGIMLVNGERLPDGGLSVVSLGNIFIKGNYNLDPTGCEKKNRQADDPSIINRVVQEKDYINTSEDLTWQPAEIITKRVVYTLSEDFPEPSYMPMAWSHSQQYYEELYRISQHTDPQDFVSGDANYPTDSWVPDVSDTRKAKSRVDLWFKYYPHHGIVPSRWSNWWINSYWPTNEIFPLDTNRDGKPDTYILGSDLQNDVWGHIESAYDAQYSYEKIHGADPENPLNPDIASQPNGVSDKHIYNTAIVTPYATEPEVLEYWGNTERVVNGSFVQLPENHKNSVPSGAYYSRTGDPKETFNYETRYGRDADPNDLPSVGLAFGAEHSWREIRAGDF